MFKIKGEWYCRIHKTFDNLRFEKDVIRLILSGDLDDAKPFLVPSLLGAVDRFHHAMIKALKKNTEDVYWHATAAKDNLNGSKKAYAAMVLGTETGTKFKKYLFSTFDRDLTEEEIFDMMVTDMIANTTSGGAVERTRFLIDELKWHDFLEEPVDVDLDA